METHQRGLLPIYVAQAAAGGSVSHRPIAAEVTFPDGPAQTIGEPQDHVSTQSRPRPANLHAIDECNSNHTIAQPQTAQSRFRWRLRAEEKRQIDSLLAERATLAVPLSTIFILFSALDWIVYPQHAGRWLIYRVSVFGLVCGIDWLTAINGRRTGFGLAALCSLAYSACISMMTYESGGFASGYYVGLLALAAAVFVVFPLDFKRGTSILAMITGPYFLLNLTYGDADVARVVNNATFLLCTVGFFVLGGHLHTRLLMQHYRDQGHMRGLIRQLEDSSRRDPLTQLFNRRHLNEHLSNELPVVAEQPPLTFALADLDYFKRVNDRFGHQAGDHILIEVAHAIRASVRRYDVVFRYGGEEFAIIFACTDANEAKDAVERLRFTVESLNLSWRGAALDLTTSIGVTTAVPDDTPESIVRRADEALYQAKNLGRNRIVTA